MFKIIIEGVEVTPTTQKNYKALCRGLNIIAWLKVNNNDVPKAAIFFDFHEGSLRKKIRKLGYVPNPRRVITRQLLETAILEHMDTKTTKVTVKESGFHRMAIETGMRRLGYCFLKQCYLDKPAVKASWQNILYNKVLSYQECV